MIIVFKSNDIYDYDYDFDNDFNDLIQLIQIYFVKFRFIIDEKFLILKKILNNFYAKKFKTIIDVKMNDHKTMNTYKRMKRFNFSSNIKILSFKLIYKIKKNFDDDIIKFKTR